MTVLRSSATARAMCPSPGRSGIRIRPGRSLIREIWRRWPTSLPPSLGAGNEPGLLAIDQAEHDTNQQELAKDGGRPVLIERVIVEEQHIRGLGDPAGDRSQQDAENNSSRKPRGPAAGKQRVEQGDQR